MGGEKTEKNRIQRTNRTIILVAVIIVVLSAAGSSGWQYFMNWGAQRLIPEAAKDIAENPSEHERSDGLGLIDLI